MSDANGVSDAVKKFRDALEKDQEYEKEINKKTKEVREKRLLVDEFKLTHELERINQNKSDMARAKNVNVGIMSDEEILDTQAKNRAYLEGAKNGMLFLNESFRKVVPLWAGCLALVGARTGGGKSSATANLILTTMTQKNPITGENRKVLTISCEETPLQVYNRLTCLVKGYDYNDQESYTDEQKQTLVDFSGKWPKLGVTVIGEDGRGRTDSVEGIRSIFEALVASGIQYDLILIDYIQKIINSKSNPNAEPYDVLKEVMSVLDHYKNVYPAGIVVLSQLSSQKSGDPENELDFQDRLRGSRDIITPCTIALEMVPDFQRLKTRWYVRKNRYKGSTVGGYVDTAYDRGRFKPLTTEWERSVAERNEAKERKEAVGKYETKKENADGLSNTSGTE